MVESPEMVHCEDQTIAGTATVSSGPAIAFAGSITDSGKRRAPFKVDKLKSFVRKLSSRTINTTFGIAYGIALLMALFPPLYLAASGIQTPILGIPISIMYWIVDALIVGLALWALYAVEGIRGELDEVHIPAVESEVAA